MTWHVGFHSRNDICFYSECGCELLSVSIACAFRWGVASIGFTLLSVAHLIWKNILGAGSTSVDGAHARPQL